MMDTSEEAVDTLDIDTQMESSGGEEAIATTVTHQPHSNDASMREEDLDESVVMATSPASLESDDKMATSPNTSQPTEVLDQAAEKVRILVSSASADTGEENLIDSVSSNPTTNGRVPLNETDERKATASTSRAPENATHQTRTAQQTWEMNNDVKFVNNVDELYKYDAEEQQKILKAKPWGRDPHFFKNVKISALALLKMVMHARSGGNIEIMGLLLGKVDGNTMIVMDAFALPVEGTETRVNAQTEAYEYMSTYINSSKEVGRLENAVGWYHSHPGYGCWLSGIDVSTQMLNQQYQEPFVAIVVDPIRTISAGKVCIGAFRTYPKDYQPPSEENEKYQTIPLEKIEDFGVHCKRYYSLDISYFKSSLDCRLLDSLWNKYWVTTLSSSSLITNADYLTRQIYDLSEKLKQASSQQDKLSYATSPVMREERKADADKLVKATKDCTEATIEMLHGSMAQVLKNILFRKKN